MASRQVECNNKRQTIGIKLIVCLLHYEGQSKAVTVKMGFSKGLAQKPRQDFPSCLLGEAGSAGAEPLRKVTNCCQSESLRQDGMHKFSLIT